MNLSKIVLPELFNIFFIDLQDASQGYGSVGAYADCFIRAIVKDKTREEAGLFTGTKGKSEDAKRNSSASILPTKDTLRKLITGGEDRLHGDRYHFSASRCKVFVPLEDKSKFYAMLKTIPEGKIADLLVKLNLIVASMEYNHIFLNDRNIYDNQSKENFADFVYALFWDINYAVANEATEESKMVFNTKDKKVFNTKDKKRERKNRMKKIYWLDKETPQFKLPPTVDVNELLGRDDDDESTFEDEKPLDDFILAIDIHHKKVYVSSIYGRTYGGTPVFITKLELNKNEITLQKAIEQLTDTENVLLIYGVGGAGKTFMISHNLMYLQEAFEKSHVLYVPLNELVYLEKTTDESALDTYNVQNGFIKAFLNVRVFSDLDWETRYALRSKTELILFLDGFNEVPVHRRNVLAAEVKHLSKTLKCKIVIASRYEDMLAQAIHFGVKARVAELTEAVVVDYLIKCESNITLTANSLLSKLLLNPLILTLFGNTAYYHRGELYENKRRLCKWININNNEAGDTQVLWNYLHCEILRANDHEPRQIFLAWLSVNILWPRLAYYMQKKDGGVFYFTRDELHEQSEIALGWIKENVSTHPELKRVANEAVKNFGFGAFKRTVKGLTHTEVFDLMLRNQAFFGGNNERYRFLHQSIRDCFAAMHLVNVAPSENEPFPVEWKEDSFSKNIYMLHHLSELGKLDKKVVFRNALECLRDREINGDNWVLKNLLLVFNQPSMFGGDFSGFDFSRLDLRYCELTEFTLGKRGKGANFYRSKIGANTFLRDTHHAPVHNIKVSSNSKWLLSSGKDKILLWRFAEKIVEKEIYRFPIRLGELDRDRNLCCFSADEDKVIFTEISKIYAYDLNDDSTTEYFGARGQITSLSSLLTDDGVGAYIATDIFGNIYVWEEVSPDAPKVVVESSDDDLIFYTTSYNEYLRYDKAKQELCIVDSNRNYTRNVANIPLNDVVACDVAGNLFAIVDRRLMTKEEFYLFRHGFINEYVPELKWSELYMSMLNEGAQDRLFACEAFVVDLMSDNQSPTGIVTDVDVKKVSFAQSGRWYAVTGTKGGEIRTDFCQRMNDVSLDYESKYIRQGYADMQTGVMSSFFLHENRMIYGHANGLITVNEIHQNDDERYYFGILSNQPPSANDFVLLPNSQHLVAGYEDGIMREWNYELGTCIFRYEKHHADVISCLAIARDKTLIVSGGYDGKVLLWDFENKVFLRELVDANRLMVHSSWDAQQSRIQGLTFTNDDSKVIFCCGNGDVFIIDIETSAASVEYTLAIRNDVNFQRAFCYYSFLNEDRIVTASSGDSSTLSFWRLDYGKNGVEHIFSYQLPELGKIRSLKVSPTQERILVSGDARFIIEFNATKIGMCFPEGYIIGRRAKNFCYDCYEKGFFFTTRTKSEENTVVRKITLEEGEYGVEVEYSELHSYHKNYNGNYINRIRVDGDVVITCAVDGLIYVSDSEGKQLQKMLAYVPISDKLNWCENVSTMEFDPTELRDQFMAHRIESIVKGDFEIWLNNGMLFNIFHMIALDYSSVLDNSPYDRIFGFCSELRDCKNRFEALQIIVKSFVACTSPMNLDADGEYALLLMLISYLQYECPPSQRNLPTLAILLIDGLSYNNTNNKMHHYDYVFQILRHAKGESIVTKCYEDYKKRFFDRNDSIINSLLGGSLLSLRPLLGKNMHSTAFYDAAKFAKTMVMSFSNIYEFPSVFDNNAIAQEIFIEMLCHYLNDVTDVRQRKEKFVKLLNQSVEKALLLFRESFAKIDGEYGMFLANRLRDFDSKKADYMLLASANRRISDFDGAFL